MTMVTEQEFDEWQQNSVTIALKAQIKKDIQLMQDMLLTVEEDDLKQLQGRCLACINLLDVRYGDLFE